MIWPILFMLFFAIFARRLFSEDQAVCWAIKLMILSVMAAPIAAVGFFVAMLVGVALPQDLKEVETIPLDSFSGEIMGNPNKVFLVGIRQGERTRVYYYNTRGLQRALKTSIFVRNVNLEYRNSLKGELKVYAYTFRNPRDWWFAIPSLDREYEFFVPEGGFLRGGVPR